MTRVYREGPAPLGRVEGLRLTSPGLTRGAPAPEGPLPKERERRSRGEVTGVLPPLWVRAAGDAEIHEPVRNLEEQVGWCGQTPYRNLRPTPSPGLTQVHCRDGGFVLALVHSCRPVASLHMYRSVGRPLRGTPGVR